ncbi:hypothetical protein FE257_003276 [Aspergillus nanangensis]|uniref:FHA domain protein n=1 Tax=Aspergillus nanangensis TaxID=2582783 RepID=A0AAD4CSB5_ASPNN|nr:hypothetical protein FE257_003276 [Aspergillus nanangensis]
MAASVAASASNHLASDSHSASSSSSSSSSTSPLRRFSQLRAYTQNHFSSRPVAPSTNRQPLSRRHTLASRISWFSPASFTSTGSEASHPSLVVGTNTSPAPCPESEQSTFARYSSAFFPGFRGLDIELRSRPTNFDSSISPLSNDPSRSQTQGRVMARQRASSHTPAEPHLEATSTPSALTILPSTDLNSTEPVMTENPSASLGPKQKATIRFFPHQDSTQQNSRPSLPFIPISRTLPSESCVIRVGRYSERDGLPSPNPSEPSDAPVGFKSKVVSRKHCEFLHMNGQWHVKDVGSSSGTFLNHMRLSQPNMVSRLYTVKDGDIVQLGIDFRGGEEMIFRCVRIRIECNRSWQQRPNEFNKNTESLIRNLGKGETADYSGCRECSICLGSVLRPYQCLFMAACAHVWHYKCVSRLIHTPDYPMFQCPNCRAYTDLSAEVDDSNDLDDSGQNPTTVQETKKDSDEPRVEEIRPESASPPPLNIETTNGRRNSDDHRLSSSLPFAAGLAANIENMRLDLHDEPTEDAEESPRSTDPSLASTSDSLVERASNLDVPGWQSLGRSPTLQCRQAHLRSDTPVRSESSDDNPLTPRNDSGPLAFDGRAGMS